MKDLASIAYPRVNVDSHATRARRTCVAIAGIASFAALTLVPDEAHAARAYGVAGTKAVAVKTLDSSTRLVAPVTGGPYPLLIASHGFSATGDNQLGWAKHFASWGFVVAVPTFAGFAPDIPANAALIEALVTKLQGPLASRENVAAGGFGLEGHSAGGLATTVASKKLNPAATVLFDPVDRDAIGKAAYASLCSPVLSLFAGPGGCNNQAGWRPFAKTTKGSMLAFDVKGSTHCDGENADRGFLCAIGCGGAASPTRQAVYAHYATAFFLSHLANDAAASAALAVAAVDGDAEIAGVLRGVSTCAPSAGDAGASVTPGSEGGGTDPNGGASTNGGKGSGATSASPVDDVALDASTSGCSLTPMPTSVATGAGAGLALALGALLIARRRR